jgi:hypothetical protein
MRIAPGKTPAVEKAQAQEFEKKIAPAMNVFLTRDITDKLERNTDRLNNKRYGAPKKELT